jgi:glyoxylase-like metal-dependent hydrolase (beta-lactamase superfamily II)
MRVHHLNCGCMCPLGGALFDGFSRGLTASLVCHCLLVEADQGLVLIETGFGLRDIEAPYTRLNAFFIHLNRIQFDRTLTARHKIEQLGFSARDVRHIVLTHLDLDHAGGLEDFSEATVHVMQAEADAARARQGFMARRRYCPPQWDDIAQWQHYETGGEPWFGFAAVRDLKGLPPDILMIPLKGHTRGHAGIAVRTGEGWLLHAGDAYFFRHEMDAANPRCPPGLRLLQRMTETDRPARLSNQRRLRELGHDRSADVRLFCSHDAVELEALQRRAA